MQRNRGADLNVWKKILKWKNFSRKFWRLHSKVSHKHLDYEHESLFYQHFNFQQGQCLVTGHKQTALTVSQVQGGVSKPEPAALKSSVAFKRHLAFRRAKSDALSEGDELNWARVNLQLGDTAWHLSVFDMATCDVDEVIAPLAGETDSGAQRDAAFSSAVYQLSHHTALQTHSICCCDVTNQDSSWRKFTWGLEEERGVVCNCECVCVFFSVFLCVLMRKNVSWNLVCVCVSLIAFAFMHIFLYLLVSALDLNGSFHFMCVGLTAALGSCSNSWHVMWLHYACVGISVCVLPMFDYSVDGVVSLRASALC